MTSQHSNHRKPDAGFTLIEIILVVLILGVLASVVIFAVSDTRTEAMTSGCGTDERVLATAFEAYSAANGADSLAPTGSGNDRFEQTLVDAGLLTGTSEYFDLDANGDITPEADSEC